MHPRTFNKRSANQPIHLLNRLFGNFDGPEDRKSRAFTIYYYLKIEKELLFKYAAPLSQIPGSDFFYLNSRGKFSLIHQTVF
jgi:hypothetical protein